MNPTTTQTPQHSHPDVPVLRGRADKSEFIEIIQKVQKHALWNEYFKHIMICELEINRVIADAVESINECCLDEITALYLAETEQIKQVQDCFGAGLLSQADYNRILDDIHRNAHKAIHYAVSGVKERTDQYQHYLTVLRSSKYAGTQH